jgi:hypothetical protein
MQSLLSSGPRSEAHLRQASRARNRTICRVPLLDSTERILCEIQVELKRNSISAEVPEILSAMLEALATRPDLCRGLVAAYLTESGP